MADYDIKAVEKKWQKWWEKKRIYEFDPEDLTRPIYSIDNPPRYASGGLHMGHATHYTHIDLCARYKRQRGFNVLFPLCFDVNGMPIEVNVEKKHGINMRETDRHEFIKLCEDFAEANIDEMVGQFQTMGFSMDESQYYQTNAEYYRRLTQISFIKMFEAGHVYKGEAPINWCPRCATAIADAEVEYQERKTKLNTILFKHKDSDETFEIATTRPELLCACQLVGINPEDPRAEAMAGKEVIAPVFDRPVKVVSDPKVELDFGTGMMMICSIGDKDDIEWLYKYELPFDMAIDETGKMNDLAGEYAGLSTEEAREKIISKMKEQGQLVKQEEVEQNVGTCWRCKTPIEFLKVPQWFIATLPHKEKILKAADELRWIPDFMKKRLIDWTESLNRDWVVSRQRYFATPIPLWECDCGNVVLAKIDQCYVDPTLTKPPVDKCPTCGGKLKGCQDVFDTWMDSSLSALYVGFWERDDSIFKRVFPISLRPQSHDIIRTWAFYTLLRTALLEDRAPWKDILVDGFILATDGTPMHTSLGNVVDPLELIQEHGTDPLRYFAGTCSLGIDTPVRMQDITRGSRFIKKFVNIQEFIGKLLGGRKKIQMKSMKEVDKWLMSLYSGLVQETTKHLEGYEFEKALRGMELFTWHEFADHYLELVKHRTYGPKKSLGAIYTLYTVGLGLTKMMAPYFPHLCEEIYQQNYKALDGAKSVHLSIWPEPGKIDSEAEEKGELAKEIVKEVRSWKSSKGIALNKEISLVEVLSKDKGLLDGIEDDIKATLSIKKLSIVEEKDCQERIIGIKPIYSKIGPTYKKHSKAIIAELEKAQPEEVADAIRRGSFEVILRSGRGVKLTSEHISLVKKMVVQGQEVDSLAVGDLTVFVAE